MEINAQILELLLGGETLVMAGLTIAVGYLLNKIKTVTGAPQAYAILKGRVSELRETEKYSLLDQVGRALLLEGEGTDQASQALAEAIDNQLEAKGLVL
jgi:hypothetical protein